MVGLLGTFSRRMNHHSPPKPPSSSKGTSNMRIIKLTNGLTNAAGELVIESATAYQVAINGKVRLFFKDKWREQIAPSFGFEDFLSGLR